jgi:hypothetical protein
MGDNVSDDGTKLSDYLRHHCLYENKDARKPVPFRQGANLVSEWLYVSPYVRLASVIHHRKPIKLDKGGNDNWKKFICFDNACDFLLSLGKSAAQNIQEEGEEPVW